MKPQRTSTNTLDPRNLARWQETNATVLAGNVSYGSTMANTDEDTNINCWKATGTSPGSANVEFHIDHSLGRIPNTIVGQDTDNGGVLYRGSTAWTNKRIYLKCTTASAAYNVIVS